MKILKLWTLKKKIILEFWNFFENFEILWNLMKTEIFEMFWKFWNLMKILNSCEQFEFILKFQFFFHKTCSHHVHLCWSLLSQKTIFRFIMQNIGKRFVFLLVFIILRWSFNYESNVFRYNKIHFKKKIIILEFWNFLIILKFYEI
jgi:hypothetical protein